MATVLKRGSKGAAVRELQTLLNKVDPSRDLVVDGDFGPATEFAVRAFQISFHLEPDGRAGVHTMAALRNAVRPAPAPSKPTATGFDKASLKNLNELHPLLQSIVIEARKEFAFTILDSSRNRAQQEAAFKRGASKVHFGNSAHNWTPAIAMDLMPLPMQWNDLGPFKKLAAVIMRIAKAKKIPIRWGGDWNMDGSTSDGWDFPHYELTPWRTWAKKSKPYTGK